MTSVTVVNNLYRAIVEEADESIIKQLEDIISNSFEECVKVDNFFNLPISHIVNIFFKWEDGNSDISPDFIKFFIKKLVDTKKEESLLLLEKLDLSTLEFNETLDILSCFTNSPIIQQLHQQYQDECNLPTKDTEYDKIRERDAKIASLQKELNDLKASINNQGLAGPIPRSP